MARGPTDERGAALLVVMVATAVLTILAVQLAYDTRVSLQIAANARDDLRAAYLAKSGVTLSRLVLSFQKQIDVMSSGQGSNAMFPHLQLWHLVPVGSTLSRSLFGGGAAAEQAHAPTTAPATEGEASEGGPSHAAAGDGFEAKMEDEAVKVNAQLDGNSPAVLGAQMLSFFQLVCDTKWDALFDREDENGARVTRQDLLVNLRDWVDFDTTGSAVRGSFPAEGCALLGAPALDEGFQDENVAYDRGPDRYRTKNARMDSLDELFMISGIGDAFMAAFGDQLTVYLKPEGKLSPNRNDARGLLELARMISDPSDPLSQQRLLDVKFAAELQELVQRATFNGNVLITSMDFGNYVKSLGVNLNPQIPLDPKNPNSPFTDAPNTFGIRSQARVGAVSKMIDAVVRFDDALQAASTTPGQLIHWREE